MEQVIIVGSGPAGYTAGVYAARAGLAPVIITGELPGGQLTNTTSVDNWPGDSNNLQGPELMARMQQHCEDLGVRIITEHIKSVDLAARPFRLQGGAQEFTARSLILATGSSPRLLGLPGEASYMGRGLSTCATCDGFFYKGKEVVVVGGGNVAVEDALFLAKLAAKVILIHRRDSLRAEKMLQDKFFKVVAAGKIELRWQQHLVAYQGSTAGLNGVTIRQADGREEQLPVDGVFIAIGNIPNSEFLAGQLELSNGYIKLHNALGPSFTATSVPGVFAAGDLVDHHYRQAITSAGMGCMAALDANNFLAGDD